MKNRRYFTCSIQAIYMAKEFGVKFEMRHTPEQIRDCDLQEEDIFYPFDHLDIRQPEHIESLVEELENVKKIYVALKSEAIFEPNEGDWGVIKEMPRRFVVFNGVNEWKEKHGGGYRTGIDASKIIMRDNKHFFMGELENER